MSQREAQTASPSFLPSPLPPSPSHPTQAPQPAPAVPPPPGTFTPPPTAEVTSPKKRPFCSRCARPARVCLCSVLPPSPLRTATRVIILQTAAEAKAKVRTADLVPLILSRARILPARRDAVSSLPSDALLLFPGSGAAPLDSFAAAQRPLVLLDATWDAAQRLLSRSPALQALQRAFIPESYLGRPLFRARKPPTAFIKGARSTAEAVAGALQCLEGEAASAAVIAIRRCVHEASEMQLRFLRSKGDGAGRHRKNRPGYSEGWYSHAGEEDIERVCSKATSSSANVS